MKNNISKKVFCLALISFGIVAANTASAAKVTIGGQLQYQGESHFDNPMDNRFGSRFRRLELVFKGNVTDYWSYQIELEEDKESDPAASVHNNGLLGAIGDSFIAYSGFKPVWIAFGHLSQPFGLENWSSSSSTTFVERNNTVLGSFAGSSKADYINGVYFGGNQGTISYSATIGQSDKAIAVTSSGVPSSSNDANAFTLANRNLNVSARLAWSPEVSMGSGKSQLHVSGSLVRYKGKRGTDFAAAAPFNETRFYIYGLAGAAIVGPILAQAEYESSSDLLYISGQNWKSYFGQLSYVITGESRNYDVSSATIGRVNPASTSGAWEVAIGYSVLDRDSSSSRSKTKTTNFGVNYYVNKYVKLATTYQVNVDDPTFKGGDNNILYVRAQVRF